MCDIHSDGPYFVIVIDHQKNTKRVVSNYEMKLKDAIARAKQEHSRNPDPFVEYFITTPLVSFRDKVVVTGVDEKWYHNN